MGSTTLFAPRRSRPGRGELLLSFVKAPFAWAKRRRYVDVNTSPLEVETPGQEKPRERYLTEAEISLFWRGLQQDRRASRPVLQVPVDLGAAPRRVRRP